MTIRDYDKRKRDDLPPSFSFRLGGRQWDCKARERLAFGAVERMLQSALNGGAEVLLQVRPFFLTVLVPEQVADFEALILDNPQSPLDVDLAPELMQDITEKVLNRPTTPPAEHSPGSKSTGRSSKGGSSSRATRRSA